MTLTKVEKFLPIPGVTVAVSASVGATPSANSQRMRALAVPVSRVHVANRPLLSCMNKDLYHLKR